MEDYKYMSGAGNTFYIGTDLHINSDIEVISYVADSKIEIDGVISVSINKENIQHMITKESWGDLKNSRGNKKLLICQEVID